MFRDRVVEHYRVRGYQIRENAKVRGKSGQIFACDLVAVGGLGNLVVEFSDETGFDAGELNYLKSKGTDIGAGVVVAAPRFTGEVVAECRKLGLVILDESQLSGGAARERVATPEAVAHPWPSSDHKRREKQDAGVWPTSGTVISDPVPRARAPTPTPEPAPRTRIVAKEVPEITQKPAFDWLNQFSEKPEPKLERKETKSKASVPPTLVPRTNHEAMDWTKPVSIVLYASITAIVLFMLILIFL